MIVREVFSDVDNRLSSKRIVVFVAFLLVGIAFVGDLFFKYNISENTYNGMMWIVISGLGIVGSEKFMGGRFGGRPPELEMQVTDEEVEAGKSWSISRKK